MNVIATILVLGAIASMIVLTVAPLSFAYLAAFVTLTPILGIALWRAGAVLVDAALGVAGAFHLGVKPSQTTLASRAMLRPSPAVLRASLQGETGFGGPGPAAAPFRDAVAELIAASSRAGHDLEAAEAENKKAWWEQ
ncbi:MAG: hypothetical protein HYS06_13085 [Methylocystis sp.]|nr:hypothetical protein [Methylocystis sp.]